MDTALARALMVDGQLRPNAVTDRSVLGAMRSLPREAFLPPAIAATAYLDDNVKLGGGRVLMRPMSFARLAQLAAPRAGERVLIVGAGTGYGAAVLASTGAEIVALEQDEALLAIAGPALAQFAPRVVLRAGPLGAGAAGLAPFDCLLIEGAVRRLPAVLSQQVAPGGRLVTVLAREGSTGVAVLAEPSEGGMRSRPAFDASVPLLPELEEARVFAL